MTNSKQPILVSGVQPSGVLHLGNYHGAIKNWLSLQQSHQSFFMIADFHALTSQAHVQDPRANYRYTMALDLLALGIDPHVACLFFQSDVPQHAELHLLLSMITPLQWLHRTPSFKDKEDKLAHEWLTHGFLGYPLLMSADILLYKAQAVPVGTDQLPHLELTREIARRFNHVYSVAQFPIPEASLTDSPLLPGLDGEKMSKSHGNTIYLSDEPDTLTQKIKRMKTDPKRMRRNDPGTPENCPVFAYQTLYNQSESEALANDCRAGRIGCVDCKAKCSHTINQTLAEFHDNRQRLNQHPQKIHDTMRAGAEYARTMANETICEVKNAMQL
jgi:tryptophanyl-tRNA synthetase